MMFWNRKNATFQEHNESDFELLLKLVVVHQWYMLAVLLAFSKCFVDVVKHYQKILQLKVQYESHCK